MRAAIDALAKKPLFSYGVVNTAAKLNVHKPDGSIGTVDFKYLVDHAPEPFATEWSGGRGSNVHHKFAATDFNLPTAKIYTGSSNLSLTAAPWLARRWCLLSILFLLIVLVSIPTKVGNLWSGREHTV